mmetsp:Transcript_59869/g.160277  ORF Transcript_59869/g.160277 Transcript_59869/m.160277 type:complete len:217 (-) Transcript_59869:99-749(-)
MTVLATTRLPATRNSCRREVRKRRLCWMRPSRRCLWLCSGRRPTRLTPRTRPPTSRASSPRAPRRTRKKASRASWPMKPVSRTPPAATTMTPRPRPPGGGAGARRRRRRRAGGTLGATPAVRSQWAGLCRPSIGFEQPVRLSPRKTMSRAAVETTCAEVLSVEESPSWLQWLQAFMTRQSCWISHDHEAVVFGPFFLVLEALFVVLKQVVLVFLVA